MPCPSGVRAQPVKSRHTFKLQLNDLLRHYRLLLSLHQQVLQGESPGLSLSRFACPKRNMSGFGGSPSSDASATRISSRVPC